MKMEVEKNVAVIVPTTIKRPSISSTKFEVRKYSESNASRKDNESRGSKLCYRMADLVMTMLVVFPLSIAFWRGVWQLMDYYSDVWELDPWLSIGVGYLIPFLLYYYQEPLKETVVPGRMNFILFYIISRTLLLLHSFGSVNQWRGLWKLLDLETGLGPYSAFTTLIVGIFFNISFRTFSNVLAPPLFCCVDEANTIHDCPLRFKTPSSKKCLYFWDCAFSVGVIPSLTVCCWRGLWNLADFYLYPEDPFMSAMASLGFGYIVCIILCASQPLICDFVCNLKGLVRLTIIDMTYMVGFIGCVFAWRGVWNSYNLLILFETQNMSEWVTTIVGIIGTVIFGCVSTVMVRGIAIDGDLAEDETAEWLIPYISHLRHPVNDVPFPEPWICRYLCTSQKMNSERIMRVKRRRKKPKKSDSLDGATQPLRKMNNVPNSIHPVKSPLEEDNQINSSSSSSYRNPGSRIRLSQIPHIDSSSEDELETRESMDPNPELSLYESLESVNKSRLQEVVTMQVD